MAPTSPTDSIDPVLPTVHGAPAPTTPDPTVAVSTPFELSNDFYTPSKPISETTLAPTVDATVATTLSLPVPPMMDAASPLVPTVPATTSPDPTMPVGTPFGLSNDFYRPSKPIRETTLAPTVDAAVATTLFQQSTPSMAAVSPYFPGVPTHATMQPTEAVGTPFGLSIDDYSHFDNSKMPMVAPTVDATVATALFHPSTPSMTAVSPFFPGVPTHAPMQPMEAVGMPFGLSNHEFCGAMANWIHILSYAFVVALRDYPNARCLLFGSKRQTKPDLGAYKKLVLLLLAAEIITYRIYFEEDDIEKKTMIILARLNATSDGNLYKNCDPALNVSCRRVGLTGVLIIC
jgi:hypothetical protein